MAAQDGLEEAGRGQNGKHEAGAEQTVTTTAEVKQESSGDVDVSNGEVKDNGVSIGEPKAESEKKEEELKEEEEMKKEDAKEECKSEGKDEAAKPLPEQGDREISQDSASPKTSQSKIEDDSMKGENDEDEEDENENGEDAEDDDDEESSEDESYCPPANQKDSDEEEIRELAEGILEPRTISSRGGAPRAPGAPKTMHHCVYQNDPLALRRMLAEDPKRISHKDRLGRSPLHMALLRAKPEFVKTLLEAPNEKYVAKAVKQVFRAAGDHQKDLLPTLHLSLTLAIFEKHTPDALECMKLLLAHPATNLQETDNMGRSVLHVACQQGSAPFVELLLARNADAGVRDDAGCFPLHYAIDTQNRKVLELMIGASDSSLFAGPAHPFYRCIDRQSWEAAFMLHQKKWPIPEADLPGIFDFATKRGLRGEWNFVSEKGIDETRTLQDMTWPSEIFGASSSTALITHSVCLGHGQIPQDTDDPSLRNRIVSTVPENPHRLEVLCGERGILKGDAFQQLQWVEEPPPAQLVDVLRCHEFWYVHKLRETVEAAQSSSAFRKVDLDSSDTKVTKESWNAALRACGAVIEGVDRVCNEQVRNAFCAVRPPGHHLGPAGATDKQDLHDDPEGSQGFCLLNNVAIGAAYARCVYRHIIHKVAIIDFDVHHGNGTEAVVRHVKCRQKPRTKVDTHIIRGSFWRLENQPAPTCKPWLDPDTDGENVFFASIHGYGGGFYPGTGMDCNEESPKIVNVALSPDANSADFREGFRSKILPELKAFDPDILFVSAGFDGHEDDLIGNVRLVDEDFVWVTQQLVAVANTCCQGRLVSVLEGGYNSRAEALSPFAQTVAGHVRTLMNTSPNYCFQDGETRSDGGLAKGTAEDGGPSGAAEAAAAPADGASLRDREEQWADERAKAKQIRKRKRHQAARMAVEGRGISPETRAKIAKHMMLSQQDLCSDESEFRLRNMFGCDDSSDVQSVDTTEQFILAHAGIGGFDGMDSSM